MGFLTFLGGNQEPKHPEQEAKFPLDWGVFCYDEIFPFWTLRNLCGEIWITCWIDFILKTLAFVLDGSARPATSCAVPMAVATSRPAPMSAPTSTVPG